MLDGNAESSSMGSLSPSPVGAKFLDARPNIHIMMRLKKASPGLRELTPGPEVAMMRGPGAL